MFRQIVAFSTVVFALLVAFPDAQQKPKPRTVPNGLSIVQKYRALYPTPMGELNTVKMLISVASTMGGGVYKKTSGASCGGFSCDIVCFPNERVYFDVLSDSEGAATPTWSGPMPMAPDTLANCVLQAPEIPGPIDPGPIDPVPSTNATAALQQQQIVLLMQMLQKQEEQNAALRQAITDLRAEIAKGVKIRF